MDKIELIRKEIERLRKNLPWGGCAAQLSMECNCKNEAYTEIEKFINSLPEEPVSEDLEEANKQYIRKVHNELANTEGMCWEFDWDDVEMAIEEAFKAGAKWDRKQTIDKACDWLFSTLSFNVPYYDEEDKFHPNGAREMVIEKLRKVLEKD